MESALQNFTYPSALNKDAWANQWLKIQKIFMGFKALQSQQQWARPAPLFSTTHLSETQAEPMWESKESNNPHSLKKQVKPSDSHPKAQNLEATVETSVEHLWVRPNIPPLISLAQIPITLSLRPKETPFIQSPKH